MPADPTPRLTLTREQILTYRRTVGGLDARLPAGAESRRRAAWAGLQDSMPRAALLSIHARVEATATSAWADPPLVQIWGPRYSAYVVAEPDVPVFTLGRLPDDASRRRFAEEMADRLHAVLDGQPMTVREAGAAVGVQPTALRYGTPTGRIRIRWDGARQPTVWTVPAPETDPRLARLELARRYLHVFGPSTGDAFATWAGIKPAAGLAAFHGLRAELTPVRTPIGDAWILAGDHAGFDTANGSGSPAAARLLPSGDTYFLLQGDDRELLVPDAARCSGLWTSRVWPGAVLLGGEIVGTWRRSEANVNIELWGELSDAERSAVVEEAESLPLPGLAGRMRVRFGAPLTSSPRPS